MSTTKAAALCTRCATRKVNGRCPRCPLPAGEHRDYTGTAKYREVLAAVLERDGAVCGYCFNGIDGVTITHGPRGGIRVELSKLSRDPLELAHVIPHDDGGAFEPDNIKPAHRSCNRAAGKAPMDPNV